MKTLQIDNLIKDADEHGLVLRGGFHPVAADNVSAVDGERARTLLLFGNAGSSIWEAFTAAPEYSDGKVDPLNRWSERVGNDLATRWFGVALFPFGGPPYQPFLEWARRAETLQSSPLGILIHPHYGLWHAYRFAVALPYIPAGFVLVDSGDHACDSCSTKPCLATCPVGAFTADGYDVERCYRYLERNADAECHQRGCLARGACPEGKKYRYVPDHAAFHMQKFVQSLSTRYS